MRMHGFRKLAPLAALRAGSFALIGARRCTFEDPRCLSRSPTKVGRECLPAPCAGSRLSQGEDWSSVPEMGLQCGLSTSFQAANCRSSRKGLGRMQRQLAPGAEIQTIGGREIFSVLRVKSTEIVIAP